MKRSRAWLLLLLAGSLAATAPGCGSTSPPNGSGVPGELAIEEIGRILKSYQKGNRPAPKGVKDFQRFEAVYSGAVGALKKKDVLLFWNTSLSEGPDARSTVLAYHKDVPEKGGQVLMQDGSAKIMTADEFRAAKKPEGATTDGGTSASKKKR